MPGMDGFEFVSRTQADALLRTVPSILVTSRNAVEDRRRGEQAGARAYIVKGRIRPGVPAREDSGVHGIEHAEDTRTRS